MCPSSLGCLCWRPVLPLHTYLGGKREPGKPTPKLLLGAGLELRSLPLAWSPWLGLRAASAVVGPGCCHPTFQFRYCGPGCLGGEATAPLTLRAHLPVVIALLRSSASELCMQNSCNCSWKFLMWKHFSPEASSEFVLSITVSKGSNVRSSHSGCSS